MLDIRRSHHGMARQDVDSHVDVGGRSLGDSQAWRSILPETSSRFKFAAERDFRTGVISCAHLNFGDAGTRAQQDRDRFPISCTGSPRDRFSFPVGLVQNIGQAIAKSTPSTRRRPSLRELYKDSWRDKPGRPVVLQRGIPKMFAPTHRANVEPRRSRNKRMEREAGVNPLSCSFTASGRRRCRGNIGSLATSDKVCG